MTQLLARRLFRCAVSIVIGLVILFPIGWGLLTSVKPADQILHFPPSLIPASITFEHYQRLWVEGAGHYIGNSFLVTIMTVLLCLGVGLPAAYAVARSEFAGKTVLMAVIVIVMSVPIASLLVPTFMLLASLGLLDSLFGLTLIYTAYQLPLATWILIGYIQTVPAALDNAAMMDGYPRHAVLTKIIFPLARPAMVAAGLLVVTFAWNDFVVAVVMTSTQSARTFPVAVYNFMGFFGREWGPLLAASIVSIVPVLIVFSFFQRYFVSGMTGGSVKG